MWKHFAALFIFLIAAHPSPARCWVSQTEGSPESPTWASPSARWIFSTAANGRQAGGSVSAGGEHIKVSVIGRRRRGGGGGTHFEEGEVDLLGVGILFLVHACVEVLHIQYDTQQPVHFFLGNILQVGDVVTCEGIQRGVRGRKRSFKKREEGAHRAAHAPSVWEQLRHGSCKLTALDGWSVRGGVGGGF